MSWKGLLASRAVQPHKTSKKEIESLRQLVARYLHIKIISSCVSLEVRNEPPQDRRGSQRKSFMDLELM